MNHETTFTRQGSQVQSLYRPPLNRFSIRNLRAFFDALKKSWGQTGEELPLSPLPPRPNCEETHEKGTPGRRADARDAGVGVETPEGWHDIGKMPEWQRAAELLEKRGEIGRAHV